MSRFGFSRENIKLLLDSDATRKNILEALRDMVARSKSGDLIVFQNSSARFVRYGHDWRRGDLRRDPVPL